MKISALVLAKNEEEMLDSALKQLSFVDEIVVLDQNSTDKTVQIAKKYTNNIISSKVENFSLNRNALLSEAKGEWVLYLDPDERLSEELIDEIKKTIKSPESASAYYFPRQNHILGKFQKHGGWWPDYVPRLFKKVDLEAWTGNVHESPKVKATMGYLKHPLKHMTARTLNMMLEKSTKWAKIEADLYFEAKSSKVTIIKLVKSTVVKFIKDYFIKLGMLDGKVGLISALYQALHVAMVQTYLWELQNKSQEKFKQIYRA